MAPPGTRSLQTLAALWHLAARTAVDQSARPANSWRISYRFDTSTQLEDIGGGQYPQAVCDHVDNARTARFT